MQGCRVAGGIDNEIASLEQQIQIPSAAPYLTYWHWIDSRELCGYNFDIARLIINKTTILQYELCTDKNTNGWVYQVINLQKYASKTVTIKFWVDVDTLLRSNLLIDDLSFQPNTIKK